MLEATNKYLESVQRTREQLFGANLLEAFPDSPNDDSKTLLALYELQQEMDITTKKDNNINVVYQLVSSYIIK